MGGRQMVFECTPNARAPDRDGVSSLTAIDTAGRER